MTLNKKKTIGILCSIPIVVHLFLLNKYSINLPIFDEYRLFVNFIYIFFKDPQNQLSIFLSSENESYPLIMRAITLVQIYFQKELNFNTILWVCNGFLALTLFILYKYYQQKPYLFLAAILLLLNLINQETYFRHDVSSYQLSTFALSITLFYLLQNYNKLNTLSKIFFWILFLINPLGSINGMVTSLLIVIAFQDKKSKRIALILFLLQIITIFFLKSNEAGGGLVSRIIQYNIELVNAYFIALSGLFYVNNSTWMFPMLAVLGAILFFYVFFHLFIPFNKKWEFKHLVFLFSSLSLCLIVASRYHYWVEGYISVLESRYAIYGATITLIAIDLLIGQFPKWKNVTLTALGVLYILSFNKGIYRLNHQQIIQITDASNIYQDNYEDVYENTFFVSNKKSSYLDSIHIFSFKQANILIQNTLKNAKLWDKPFETTINVANFNTNASGDWDEMNQEMYSLELKGEFKNAPYFILEIPTLEGNYTYLFLNKIPQQFWQKEPEKVNNLYKNFYANAFKHLDLKNSKLYLVENINPKF